MKNQGKSGVKNRVVLPGPYIASGIHRDVRPGGARTNLPTERRRHLSRVWY